MTRRKRAFAGRYRRRHHRLVRFSMENIIRHTLWFLLEANHSLPKTFKEGCMVDAESGRITSRLALAKPSLRRGNPNESYLFRGFENRTSKEISIRNLGFYYQARIMEEITRSYRMRLCQSGHYKILAGGIVLTGGGSQLQFIFSYLNTWLVGIRALAIPTSILASQWSKRSKVQCTRLR